MRPEVIVQQVLEKCAVLRRAQIWHSRLLRPQAWINNFEVGDREVAALLLNRFTFVESNSTDLMIGSAIDSLVDGLPKAPRAPTVEMLKSSLDEAILVPVTGENPNPTDSGNYICRRVRALLGVPEERIVSADVAIDYACRGRALVFLDDFIGSGDQFRKTWFRSYRGRNFHSAYEETGFIAAYVAAVATAAGLTQLRNFAPTVAVSVAHSLSDRHSLAGVESADRTEYLRIVELLQKYAPRLTPKDNYIAENEDWKKFGYKSLGLMLAFEHSVPDSTLPIFWSEGTEGWIPLIKRG